MCVCVCYVYVCMYVCLIWFSSQSSILRTELYLLYCCDKTSKAEMLKNIYIINITILILLLP